MGYVGNQTTTSYSSMDKQVITGDGGTGYTLSHAVANAQEIEVFVNNVRQEPAVAYTATGTTLTMTGNVESTDDFYVVYQGKAVQTATHPDDAPLTASQVNVDNLRLDGNTISSTDTNGNVTIDPDGTGVVDVVGTFKSDIVQLDAGSAPTWDTNTRLWSESGFGARYDGYQHRFDVGVSRTEAMRIDASGQIMMHKSSLGVTTAGHEFRNTGVAIHSVNNNTCMELVRFGGTGRLQEFYSTSTLVGNISTNGSSTSYNTSSDYRLKTAVNYDWDATTRLKQLKPARFEWIADGDDAVPVDGFLAHEAPIVCPESVTGTKDEVDADGNPVMQGIEQAKLVPLLCKTILELEARITALEAS